MLWQTELNAGPIDTPERRADLERRVMAQAGLIADRTVQNEYRRFFRDRLFALGRPARPARHPAGAGGPPHRRSATVRRSRCRAAAAAVARPAATARSVLGIFIAHPWLIDEWVEDLAALDFPEPELDNLRRSILEVADTGPGLDAQTLRQHLALCGHAETLGALAIATARHAGFAVCGGDDPDVIRQGLKETLQLLQTGAAANEAAADAIAADPSDDNLRAACWRSRSGNCRTVRSAGSSL